MDTLSELVQAAKAGTAGAFERIVARVHAQAVALQWVRDHGHPLHSQPVA